MGSRWKGAEKARTPWREPCDEAESPKDTRSGAAADPIGTAVVFAGFGAAGLAAGLTAGLGAGMGADGLGAAGNPPFDKRRKRRDDI